MGRTRRWDGLLAGEDDAIHVLPSLLLGGIRARAHPQEVLLLVGDDVGPGVVGQPARRLRALVVLEPLGVVKGLEAAVARVLDQVVAVDVLPFRRCQHHRPRQKKGVGEERQLT